MRNPMDFDKGFYQRFSKYSPSGIRKWPGSDGLYREEREQQKFPRVIFSDYLRLPIDAIVTGNGWIYRNRNHLPEDLQTLNLRQLRLTVRANEELTQIAWILRFEDVRLGEGRASAREDYWQTTLAKLALQGFGIYPAIIDLLHKIVGPLRSSNTLSPHAHRAWMNTDAVFDGKTYLI